eukprot:m.420825 g.420825  ORF g.420825 m.420825 type:complete len:161 (+) comp16846_c2_seq32:7548-8030(+)
MTTYSNQADFGGSLMYNINEMTGFMLSENTDDAAHKYSDVIAPGNNTYNDYITNQAAQGFTQLGGVTGANTTYRAILTQAQYEEGDWFVGGQTWLPWFPPPSDGQGGYIYRHDWQNTVYFNKARSAVLIPTATTVAKIGGIGLVTFFVGKLAIKELYKRS